MSLYCLPSDLLQDGATISVTAGTEDTAYPKTNLQDRRAHTVSKFTGTSGTFRATFSGAKTLQAVAFINSNPQEARKHLVKNTFTPEDVVDTVPMIRYYMVGDLTAKDKADFQKFIDFSVQTGTLPEKVDVTKYMQTF